MPVRVLFLTMLAIKEPDHVVRMPFRRLCKKANMPPEVVTVALEALKSPDTLSVDHQPFEGCRVQEVEGGWLILNGEQYRQAMSKLMLRLRKNEWQKADRAKKRGSGEVTAAVMEAHAGVQKAVRHLDEVQTAPVRSAADEEKTLAALRQMGDEFRAPRECGGTSED